MKSRRFIRSPPRRWRAASVKPSDRGAWVPKEDRAGPVVLGVRFITPDEKITAPSKGRRMTLWDRRTAQPLPADQCPVVRRFSTLPDPVGTLTPEAGGREMASMRADYPPLLQYRAVGEAGREERV